MRRDEHTCQLRYTGCVGDASEVDHIVNVASLGVHRAQSYGDIDNLQAVCGPCHKRKTAREAAAGRRRNRAAARRQPEPHPRLQR